jgi:tRNA G18 (ribose-2'-O)-methylase SpoU
MPQGPNVRRLIATKMSVLMIPPNTGKDALAVGIEAIKKPGNVGAVAREATDWVNRRSP